MIIQRTYTDKIDKELADKSAVIGGGLLVTGTGSYLVGKKALKELAKSGVVAGKGYENAKKMGEMGKKYGKVTAGAGAATLGYSAYKHYKNKKG